MPRTLPTANNWNNTSGCSASWMNRAKAKYALEIGAAAPRIDDKPVVHLYHARHPVLEQHYRPMKKPVIPMDIELNDDHRIVVISGPNAGGKSVSMKTVDCYRDGTKRIADSQVIRVVGIFQQLMADIGDSQSMEDELSTLQQPVDEDAAIHPERKRKDPCVAH